ncbi:MAG TPA: tRNA pseudouridine(55) synthase TruB [Dehalococcoidia bacterium]|nr:tRNA pseudouridine(55) synthase TruB [Dehalococcoidia bacterium]
MDGILNINKPEGITSYRVVSLVKRLSGERRVGHAGTLDPMATGVLPVCLDQATRIVEFLAGAAKTYRAGIELGVTTDTYDASGKVVHRENPAGIGREQVETALASFRGVIQQTPPMYSAIKHQGKKLYQLARAGITIERKSRPTTIHRLDMVDFQMPNVTVEVECGKGTYIRSLAHDLGQILGCGASLKSLVRQHYGPFDIEDAVRLPQLEDAFRHGCWEHFVHPMDLVLSTWPATVVDEATAQSIRNGAPVALPLESSGGGRCRAYTADGHFLGILRFEPENERWHPEKVFQNSRT